MRITARILFSALFFLLIVAIFQRPAYAQTLTQPSPTPIVAQTITQSSNNSNTFLTPNTDSNVPQNRDTYTQVVLINVMSAVMCQLTGIDSTNPQQPCLGVNPTTGKIGMAPAGNQTFGQAQSQPQIGGALGVMSGYISSLYVPAVSSSQYINYLASNFGIVKPTYAAKVALPGGGTDTCSRTFGYGFCGLDPIFNLWRDLRDFAYALLTILFIAIGIGIMLRFKVDPRTVMTLQNQIPRVIIAILLITFSYAIAGGMIDLMWTATYAGINFISNTSNAKIALCPPGPQAINKVIDQRLLDEPVSFTNTIFRGKCDDAGIDNGIVSLSSNVSASFGNLVTQIVADLLGLHIGGGCSLLDVGGCVTGFFLWFTEQIVKLIIIIALLIALFRLWFELIKAYVTFLIFVIMGPLWIVFGLIPGRPLGFEKWLRIIFANLAAFPLVAFMLVFARVIVDAVPQTLNPQNVFVPPLIGNPSLSTFTAFIGFGAIMIAPTIPGMIKERMKSTGQGKYGSTVAAGIGFAAGAITSPGRKTWEGLNRRSSIDGRPEGSLAIMKQRVAGHLPGVGRYQAWRRDQRINAGAAYEGRQPTLNRDTRRNERETRRNERQANQNARPQRWWRNRRGGGGA